MSENEIHGYADAFDEYWRKGWKSVLWLPKGKKFPPPSGFTGYDAAVPSYPDLMAWSEDHPDANLGLRFPAEIVGLDVDAYGEKTGASTLAEALKRYGPLPKTVRSTSRTDDVSGIRLYRKPADVALHTQIKFPGLTIGNVEIVQDHHRYCVSWPSIHPEGRMYEWRDDDGNTVPVPSVDNLPELPVGWVEGLRAESHAEITAHRDPFEALRQLPQGRMSPKVEKGLETAMRELDCEPGSRHDAANVNVLRLLRLAEMGETGVQEALARYRQKFVEMTRDRNTEGEANAEFDRMVFGQRGHDLIASTPSKENDYAVLGVADNIRQSEMLARQRAQQAPEPVVEWQVDQVDRPHAADNPVSAFLFGDDDPVPAPDGEVLDAASAFLFGQLPGPVERVEQMTGSDEPQSMRDKLLTIEGLAAVPPSEPLVEHLLYRNTLAQLSGPPGSGKTFFALGLACALASRSTEWGEHKIPWKAKGNSGSVLYIAAEGVSGMNVRVRAWCEQQQVDPDTLRFYVYPDAVQLGSFTQMEELTELAVSLDCVLVVFDTRARCSVASDENSATEQGEVIKAADHLREATGCTVLMIHHGSRSDGSTPRGSNAWDGAVWSDLRVKTDGVPDGQFVVHTHKHKDAPAGDDWAFELKPWSVSAAMMPGSDEESRNTLVAVSPVDFRPDHGNDGAFVDLVREELKTAAIPGDGLSARDIAEATGKSTRSVQVGLRILFDRGALGVRASRYYWLKEDEPHDDGKDGD